VDTLGSKGIPMTDDASPLIAVRPISKADVESFHACLDAVARERAYLGFIEGPSLETVRFFVMKNISLDVPQFVAVRAGEVVGWCDVSPETLPGFTHCGRLGMGIRKEFRGRGLGRKLLEAALKKAQAKELERVELDVYASNRAAIGLYTSSGFVAEGIRKRGRKLDGRYDDVIFMVKFLV
jgi:ribosomal protein S18 acetylase RimI-like enzyme